MIRLLRNSFLLLSILFFSFGANAQVTRQKSTTSLAYEYYNDQEWEKAATLFLRVYEENGVKPYLNNYIRCLIQLQDYKTAEKTLNKVLKEKGDISLYIDMAYLQEIQGNTKKADELFQKPMKEFPATAQDMKVLGTNYLYYLKYEYAQQVYEIGRQLLNNPNEFHLEMANVHLMQRNYSAMLHEYFELLVYQPRYSRTVQAQIRNAATRDVDETLMENAKTKTLNYIQKFPGLDVFSEMLIWIYMQEENFDRAVDLAVALDRRNKEPGNRILDLARAAKNANVNDAAVKAYQKLIEKGPPPSVPGDNRNRVSKQSPFVLAKLEILSAEFSLLESKTPKPTPEFRILAGKYSSTLEEIGLDRQNVGLMRELAYITAYRLNDLDSATAIIDKALETRQITPTLKAEFLLDKADIILIQNDPWEATFVYAQVEKENSQNPYGALAKYKKAMLAYYTGNFDWAKMQLDVLKGSTSKLIANDAFELSMMIRDNQNMDDSLQLGLKELSKADYLYFQKKTDSCMMVLESLISTYPDHPVRDDALFKKAEIQLEEGSVEDAQKTLEIIADEYLYDLWGHKALFYLANIYENKGNIEKALNYYQQILDDFPNSFYNLDSRNRIRILNGDVPENDEEL